MPRHLSESELQRLLDGTLGPAGRKRAEGHLDGCAECRTRRDEAAWLFQRLAAGTEAGGLDLVGQVMASVEELPTPKPARGRVYAIVLGALASLIAAGAFFFAGGGAASWSAWFAEAASDFAILARAAGALLTAVRAGGPLAIAGVVIVAGMLTAGLAATAAAARALIRRPRRARVAVEPTSRTES